MRIVLNEFADCSKWICELFYMNLQIDEFADCSKWMNWRIKKKCRRSWTEAYSGGGAKKLSPHGSVNILWFPRGFSIPMSDDDPSHTPMWPWTIKILWNVSSFFLGIADSRSLVSSNSKDSGGQIDMVESKGKKLF